MDGVAQDQPERLFEFVEGILKDNDLEFGRGLAGGQG